MILFFVLLILSPGGAWADFATPEDAREHWTVGVSALRSENLSTDSEYLVHSLPLLIREGLESIRTHHFSETERTAHRKAILLEAQRALGQELLTARRERDELLFSDEQEQMLAEKLEDYEKQIAETIDHLNFLKDLDPQEIEFGGTKTVKLSLGRDAALLLDPPAYSPLRMARQNQLDLLIWGKAEEIQDYILLELFALDTVQEQEVFVFKDAAPREELYQRMDQIIQDLGEVLWGRDWASIRINPEPEQAAVYLDDQYIGRGETVLPFVVPGVHHLRVTHAGYIEATQTVDLPPYNTEKFQIVLEPEPADQILLQSDPPGAVVYQDSLWLGLTPIKIDRPNHLVRLLLKAEGYDALPFYLDQSSPASLSLSLPEPADLVEIQKQHRDAFYMAFGIFALSIPFPMALWSLTTESAIGYQDAAGRRDTAADRLYDSSNRYYSAYWGTLMVSISLFINMSFSLIKYIRAADRKAG